MARKSWDQLSPAYRKRLERSGITEQQHTGGATLHKARGHVSATRESYYRLINTYAESYVNYYGGSKGFEGAIVPDDIEDVKEALRNVPEAQGLKAIREQQEMQRLYHKGKGAAATRRWETRDTSLPEYLFFYHGWFA